MSVSEARTLITGQDVGHERRRLLAMGLSDDSPEMAELWRRMDERDEYLFERYGRPFLETHPGEWIAISLDGEVFLADTAGEVVWLATERVGRGNFCSRKLGPIPGHRIGL